MNLKDKVDPSTLRRTEQQTDGPHRAYAPATDYWYVVCCKPGLGNRALALTLETLTREGFEYYRPMFMRMKRARQAGVRSTTLRPAAEPLFGTYMFVRRLRAGKTAITSIFGIEGSFLGAVRNEMIEAIRATEQDGYISFVRRHDNSRHLIRAGDTVETLDGLLRAVVAEVRSDGRLALLSQFMGGSSRLIVGLAQVVRIQAAEEAPARSKTAKGG